MNSVKKRGLSIRYKILLLLTAIPLVVLSAYLVLALRIFENDKIAYVFDSSSNVSGTMAAQVRTQLNSVLGTTKSLFQDYLSNQKFSAVSDSIFANDENLDAVVVFRLEADGAYAPVAEVEKETGLARGLITQLGSVQGGSRLGGFLAEADRSLRAVKAPFKDDRVLIFEKVTDEKTKRANIFMVAVRLSETAEMFRANSAQKMYLLSQDGMVLFGPESSVGQPIQKITPLSFLANSARRVTQGAETARGADGTDLLISFSKTGFADLYVVSAVSKAKALGALQILIRKSLIFFVILICLTAIISLFASNSLTSALTSLFEATKKVSEGDFNFRVKVTSNDEVGSLADNFNIMAGEVSRLLEQTAEKARMQSELQTAKTVQETLFPDTHARLGPLDIAGFYEPASECGGDWWHYSQVGSKIFLWIGDATGHGAPAALITSAAKSASTIIERLNVSPAEAMELLNRSIYDVSKGRIMMTFFVASFDPATGEMVYCNASHEAPMLIKKSDQALKKKDLILLNEVNNPRLGQARDSVYTQTSIQLSPEDAVFFYTDGIPDIQNPLQAAWGERDFLKSLVATNKNYPDVAESVSSFVQIFQDHRQGAPLIDDVTFFMVKYNVT